MAEESGNPRSSKPKKSAAEKSGTNGLGGDAKPTYSQAVHRTLPHSTDAEQGLLGSMLIDAKIVDLAIERIRSEHFYVPAHQLIFDTVRQLHDSGRPVDFIVLTQVLQDQGKIAQVGGAAFVTHLFTFVPTSTNASYYMEILEEKYILRTIITTCTECATRAYDQQDEANTLLDEVEKNVYNIGQERFKKTGESMQEMVLNTLQSIMNTIDRGGASMELPTGFSDLDRMTNGLHGAEMFIIAARPSMGKTALAMNIAEHMALESKKGVVIFSLEMSSQALIMRLLCSIARVDMKQVRDGILPKHRFDTLTEAASLLSEAPMFIDDTAGLSILELRAKARRLKSKHDIQLIVIDYLQLLRSTSRRAQDNRQLEIAEISSGLKALAKELNIPIIVLAQLNRNPETRGGKSETKGRPRLSDLRESGSIEQDADVVGLLWREEYYADSDEERESAGGKAILSIAKQRNGPTGDVHLTFLKEFTRFEDSANVPEEH